MSSFDPHITHTTRDLLRGLDEVPVVHFGDLDPNGIAILAHLVGGALGSGGLCRPAGRKDETTKDSAAIGPTSTCRRMRPTGCANYPNGGSLQREVVAVNSRFGTFLRMEIRRALSK
jgi:hypothetical protein